MRKVLRIVLPGVLLLVLAGVSNAASDIEMVYVKGGCYQMGDTFGGGNNEEKPVHEVCVDDFYIGTYLVTQAQWQAVMGNNPSHFKECGGNCPVEKVSWEDVQEFIARLNELTGKKYRLPYEAEWEYAARSRGKQQKYSGGNDADSVAWHAGNSGGRTHPVGTKSSNGLGIYDMSGNVWEWVQDCFSMTYYSESPGNNPQGPVSGSYRVERGGSWFTTVGRVRSATRRGDAPAYSIHDLGFRLARTK